MAELSDKLKQVLAVVREMAAAGQRVTGGTLAARLGCNQSTASQNLRRIETAGHVRRHGRGGYVRYIPLSAGETPAPVAAVAVGQQYEVMTRWTLDTLRQWLVRHGHKADVGGDVLRLNGIPYRTRGEFLAHANLLRHRRGECCVVLE